MRALSALAALVAALGCAATHHPAPRAEPERADALRRELAGWTVGVREPVIRYSEPGAPGPDVLDEVRDAGRLVAALRDTSLFADVKLTGDLACPPRIELVVRAHAGERSGPAPAWLWLASLSVSILESDEGITFTPAAAPDELFDFPYSETLVVGVLPALASPVLLSGALPRWSFRTPTPRTRDLELFLLANADRLSRFEQPQEPCKAARSR